MRFTLRSSACALAMLAGICPGGPPTAATPRAPRSSGFIPPPDSDAGFRWVTPTATPSPTPLSPELQAAADLAEALKLLEPAAMEEPPLVGRIEFASQSFKRGEPIIPTIVLRNAAKRPLRIDVGGDYRTGRSSRIEIELSSPKDTPVVDSLSVITGYSMVGGIGFAVELKPGEEHRVPFLLQLYRAPLLAGEYRLRVRFAVSPSSGDAPIVAAEGRFRIERSLWRGINAEVLQLFDAHGVTRDPCLVAGFLPDERRIPELLDKLTERLPADDVDAGKADRNRVRSALDALLMMPVDSLAPILLDRLEAESEVLDGEKYQRLLAPIVYSARTAEWRSFLRGVDPAKYPRSQPVLARIATLCGLPPMAAELNRERIGPTDLMSPIATHTGALLAYHRRCVYLMLPEEPPELRERSAQLLFRLACDPHRPSFLDMVSAHLSGGRPEYTWVVVEHALREHFYPGEGQDALTVLWLALPNPLANFAKGRESIPVWIREQVFAALRLRVLLPHGFKDREWALWLLACLGDARGVELLAPRLLRGTDAERLAARWSLALVGASTDPTGDAAALVDMSYGEGRFPGRYATTFAARGFLTTKAAERLMETDDQYRGGRNPPSRGVRLMLIETAIARSSGLPQPDWLTRPAAKMSEAVNETSLTRK